MIVDDTMEYRTLNVDGLSREKVREKILRTWMEEDPGVGQYRYDVENCSDNSKIYLLRPGPLNKGCDFIIISENFLKFKNGNDKPPRHRDVFMLIASFVHGNKKMAKSFLGAAQDVYKCLKPDDCICKFHTLKTVPDCKAERSLKLLKWMWIEQDITYWTQRGREMLWNGLCSFIKKTS